VISVVRIGDLPLPELALRLQHEGVSFHSGPFLVHFRTGLSAVAETFRFLYHDVPLENDDELVDFRTAVQAPAGIRRWWRPQAMFLLEHETPFRPFPSRLAPPMLEWGLNWCIATHDYRHLTIHAAVVERDGRAVILPGPPGSGKSTLCAALVHRGWRLLGDEFALVRPEDGRIDPLPRPISLKEGSIDVLRERIPRAPIGTVTRDTLKGAVAHLRPPAESVARMREPASPSWIVFPRYASGAASSLAPVPRARAFFRVADQSFNFSLLARTGFETLASVIEACDAYEITYSDLDEAMDLVEGLPVPCGLGAIETAARP
jgi:HprK-related kinase A